MTNRLPEPTGRVDAPRVLAISDRRQRVDWALAEWVVAIARAGVDTLQLREKDLDDRSLFELLETARSAAPHGLRIVVNGRVDLAWAAGAAGIHLPANGIPVATLRRRFGSDLLIGCSTHHPDEVQAARDDGADYVTFGPIWDTSSKRAYGAPPGLAGLREAVAVGLPVLALGGVQAHRLHSVAAAGAAGFAGIRAFARPSALTATLKTAASVWPIGVKPAPV